MSKEKPLVPRPTSKFLVVKCEECGNEQTIFSHATVVVKCEVCGNQLSKPTGGKAIIKGEVTQILD